MIRALFGAQFMFFLCFGAIAGMAFSFYLDHAVAEAKEVAVSGMFAAMSPRFLSEIDVRPIYDR